MIEALFYEKVADRQVRCELCRFRCTIKDGRRGVCNVRENRDGTLFSLVYGRVIAEHVDPIEKKPLFHLLPGSRTFSVATEGCNFRCRHCQNYSIAQVGSDMPVHGVPRTPAEIVQSALDSGCSSIAYTYTEPTIFFEFAYDTARLASEAGRHNIFVTNGYISQEPLAKIAPYLAAANIDLKGFSERFYRDIVGAKLAEVLAGIVEYKKLGIWLEITTLIIPGLNDSDAELQGITDFIVNNLGVDTPWHVSQFYPTYRLTDLQRTPAATLRRAREIGTAAGLHFVYEGNIPGEGGEHTSCPDCGEIIVKRNGFRVISNRLQHGCCPACSCRIAGIWT